MAVASGREGGKRKKKKRALGVGRWGRRMPSVTADVLRSKQVQSLHLRTPTAACGSIRICLHCRSKHTLWKEFHRHEYPGIYSFFRRLFVQDKCLLTNTQKKNNLSPHFASPYIFPTSSFLFRKCPNFSFALPPSPPTKKF